MKRAGRLILVRHGESLWNITDKSTNRVTRFTGWADIPMSELGRKQALAAGKCLSTFGITFDAIYTSVLKRSVETYELLVKTMPMQKPVPVISSWRLNERHYGSLVGLSKEDAELEMGKEDVISWRRSWDARPPPMTKHPFYHSFIKGAEDGHPPVFLFDWQSDIWTKALTITRIPKHLQYDDLRTRAPSDDSYLYDNNIRNKYAEKFENPHDDFIHISDGLSEPVVDHNPNATIPNTESLRDTADRVMPLWRNRILPRLLEGETVLVVGHSNTIRSMVKHLDNIDPKNIQRVAIPSAVPLVYNFAVKDTNLIRESRGLPPIADSEIELVSIRKPSQLGMTGRFVVTDELLDLTLKASQNMELSENLDDTEEFKELVQETRQRMRDELARQEEQKNRMKAMKGVASDDKEAVDEGEAVVELPSGWMNLPHMDKGKRNKL